jgi:SAM-dependent methyltransferase
MQFDNVAARNQKHWDEEARRQSEYVRPWLDLDRGVLQAYARGEIPQLPPPYLFLYPPRMLKDVAGKKVLCLASGGGQQSAAYGLLGADVTVLDLCAGQLESDQKAARHHGYEVRTIQGDMRDLSIFGDASFDMVYQSISIVYVPDVRQVYREVARVLKPGGLYFSMHDNPTTDATCFDGSRNGWDGIGYRIAEPYIGGPVLRRLDGSESMTDGEPIGQFRHLLSDMFNGLIEADLRICGVYEDPRCLTRGEGCDPGSYEHRIAYTAAYIGILARKDAPV